MPYRWTPAHHAPLPPASSETGKPLLRLDVWPHRSLPSKGFSAAIWLMFAAGLMPVIPFIGTTAFWILLACMMSVLTALWIALRKSDRDHLREEMLIWHDRITLTHWTAKGDKIEWSANPYWVRTTLHPTAKIEQYLTLKGAGPDQTREVELGAFLSPEERIQLRDDLALVLDRVKTPAASG
ncbi:DUF2244 domain-containing protein [Celeribacter marinus]|uniref:DUF2244 domain-containing protein n=1 Tax=Celeribacter marinus TaxID=1397108 RepID=UPI003F6A9749